MGERSSGYERHAEDWYIEPAWCVKALALAEPFRGSVCDPACGAGTVPEVFAAAGHPIHATDIVNRGYARFAGVRDFLAGDYPAQANIVSNPPYQLAERFARRALAVATQKVALLVNLKFLASQGRHALFTATPVRRVHILSARPSMPPGEALRSGAVKAANGSQDYCWMVWEHGYTGGPEISWLMRPAQAQGQTAA